MKTYRRSLPPLDHLLFFHAAARAKSLSVAADKLFVTQAAVSKRIHRFEEWLGTPLFSRNARSLEVTEAGSALAMDVELALDFLERAIDAVKTPEQPIVRLAANNFVSMFWLHSRLKAFSLSERACNVSVLGAENNSELLSDMYDLAIVYCDGKVPGWEAVSLIGGELVPAASPELARRAEHAGMFTSEAPPSGAPPLLEYVNLTPEWINWQLWLKRKGFAPVTAWPTVHCSSYAQSIGKGLAGEGILLASRQVLDEEFANGALVQVGHVGLSPRKSYHLCYKKDVNLSESTKNLLEFLVGQTP